MKTYWLILFLSLLACPAFAVNKCTDASGNVTFQDLACANSEATEKIKVADNRQRLAIPGVTWGLSYEAPKLHELERRSENEEFQYLAKSAGGFVMSAFVEPALGKGHDPLSCGDYYWQRTSRNPAIIPSTVDRTDAEQFIIVSYAVQVQTNESWIVQGNYNIYGYRDGRCIDIHLSKLFADDADISFDNFIRFASSLEYYPIPTS